MGFALLTAYALGLVTLALIAVEGRARRRGQALLLAAVRERFGFDRAEEGRLVAGIHAAHQEAQRNLRIQLEEQAIRARILERNTADASTSLEVSVELLRESRQLVELLRDKTDPDPFAGKVQLLPVAVARHRPRLALAPPPPAPPDEDAEDSRPTGEDFTKVLDRKGLERTMVSPRNLLLEAAANDGDPRGAA